ASRIHRDAIHLPLDQDGVFQFANRFLRVIQIEQHARLRVNRSLRRIQILRPCLLIRRKRAPGERNHLALFITDGEHYTIAEFGINGGYGFWLLALGFWLEAGAVRCSLFAIRARSLNRIVILSGAKDLLWLSAEC